ncbi:MAG: imidazole glycerol phosphate synthase subunit HisH [Candidatus Yanofskybacteria bacterium]|nr:imidazole glycerol phosphate synthase subunit HisH [Candidatus Yanofskybacteria bacterium]
MIVIVDYGLGNLFSVRNAFKLLGVEVIVSSKPNDIKNAERLILPGVGAFGDGMNNLKAKGLDEVIIEEVSANKKPFLGICLGLQLLADIGFEYGENKGLGLISGNVRKLEVESRGLKVPHIGWNNVSYIKESPLFKGIKPDSDFYFVHSYQLICGDKENLVATAQYGETITAAIQKNNIFASQFHPEKSQENGLKLLENFVNWKP